MADIYCDYLNGSDSTGNGTSGNPYKTAGFACGAMAGGDRLLILATATQVISVNSSNVSNGYLTPPAGSAGAPTRIVGLSSAGGSLDDVNDFSGFPLLQQATNALTQILNIANGIVFIRNLVVDGNSNTSNGASFFGNFANIANVKVTGCTIGLNQEQTEFACIRCLLTGNGTGLFTFGNSGECYGCIIAGNTAHGVNHQGNCNFTSCLIYANAGATTDGIDSSSGGSGQIVNCVLVGNGRDGLRLGDRQVESNAIQNNILGNNGGYNLLCAASDWSGVTEIATIDRNFLYTSTSGNYHFLPAGPHDTTLSGDPFTNAGGGNFSLNTTAGAGASVRGAGWPGVFPGGLTTGYLDGGAAQHQDSGGTPGPIGKPIIISAPTVY